MANNTNLLHLPTEETLAQGLGLIAEALDGDKIAQISAKLSSASKNLSEINTYLSTNLSSINTQLTAKGGSTAATFSEVPGKIEDIPDTVPFRITTASATVTNGAFTVAYEGELPAGFLAGSVRLAEPKIGVVETSGVGIAYPITADTTNKTLTFSLLPGAPADGVITAATTVVAAVYNVTADRLETGAIVELTGIPVKYEKQFVQPKGASGCIQIDPTQANTIALTDINGVNVLAPQGVSPAATFYITACAVLMDTQTSATYTHLTVSGTSIEIPANTLQEGLYELLVYLEPSSGTVSGTDEGVITLSLTAITATA